MLSYVPLFMISDKDRQRDFQMSTRLKQRSSQMWAQYLPPSVRRVKQQFLDLYRLFAWCIIDSVGLFLVLYHGSWIWTLFCIQYSHWNIWWLCLNFELSGTAEGLARVSVEMSRFEGLGKWVDFDAQLMHWWNGVCWQSCCPLVQSRHQFDKNEQTKEVSLLQKLDYKKTAMLWHKLPHWPS